MIFKFLSFGDISVMNFKAAFFIILLCITNAPTCCPFKLLEAINLCLLKSQGHASQFCQMGLREK